MPSFFVSLAVACVTCAASVACVDSHEGDGNDGEGESAEGEGESAEGEGEAAEGEGEGSEGEGEGEGEGGPVGEPRTYARIFFVGHSLVNHEMPAMLKSLAQDAGYDHLHAEQVINGAPLKYNWENHGQAEGGVSARDMLPSGEWDTLVITEAIPLAEQLMWNDSYGYAQLFYELAVDNGAHETFLYETWHSLDTPNWRARIDQDLDDWEGIVNAVNAASDGPEMRLVPAGQALGRLVDAIEDGTVPGLSNPEDLFADDIHLNDTGNYFIACVQLAALYRHSPEGLTGQTHDRFGAPFANLSASTAARLQEIAWDAVSAYAP